MRTLYRIDDFQQVYFVIDSIEALKAETLKDFGPIYNRLKGADDIVIDAILPGDRVFTRGTTPGEVASFIVHRITQRKAS